MKKPSLATVIGMGKKPKVAEEAEESEAEGSEYSEEQTVMAQEMIDAMKADDPKALLKAFHGLFASYEMMPHEEMDEPMGGKMKAY